MPEHRPFTRASAGNFSGTTLLSSLLDPWFVLYTQPLQEQLCAAACLGTGAEVYSPRLARRVSHARRITERVVALFPRYIFVRPAPGRMARELGSARYAVRLVRQGETPAVVADYHLETIRAMQGSDGVIRLDYDEPVQEVPLRRGDLVRVTQGPATDVTGTVIRLSGHERVQVMMGWLGTANFPRHMLERVDGTRGS